MTPTLTGRIQTRLGLALLAGVPLALLLAALLGGLTVVGSLVALAGITLLGLGWELLYQRLQQRRWDRDWPTSFALGSGLPEGVVSWFALGLAGLAPASFGTHVVFFGTLWLVTFVAMQGPMRVLAPHWRFQGMRVVPQPLVTRTAPAAAETEPDEVPEPEPLAVAAAESDESDRLRIRLPAFPLGLQPTALQRGLGVAALAFIVVAAIAIGRPAPAPEAAGGDVPMLEGPDQGTDSSATPKASPATWDTTARVRPVALVIPRLGMREKLQPVGLTELGNLQAPEAGRVGWYDEGATPGQRGPAVLAGDRGTVFSRVASLPRSERFLVTRADGSRVEFVVDRVRAATGDAFPTRQVYGPTKRPELRLVGYDDDEYVIVFAHATSLESKATHG